MTDEVQHFLKSPEALAGLARGRNIQRVENSARQLRGESPRPMTDPAIKFADDGTPQIVGHPNMRSLDSIKRGLDAMLEVYRQPNGRLQLDEHGRAIEQVRKAYLAQLDVGSDPYKQARAAWAGPSEALDAMRFGRAVPRLDRDVVTQRAGDMTPGVRDFMRIGASRAYTDAAADPARAPGVVRNMTRNRTTQAKLDTIIDDPAQRAGLDRAMAAERAMQDTNAVINPRANSQTGRLSAGQELIEDTKPTMFSKALRRKAEGLNPFYGFIRDTIAKGSVGPQGVTDHAGSLLFNRNRPEVIGILKMLESRMVDDAMRDQQKSQLMRLMMGSGAPAFSQQGQ